MLTVFANFRINDVERLKRMKDSFHSFYEIDAEWVINIRGQLKYEAANYLKSILNDKSHIEHLESKKGWIYDTLQLQKFVKTQYILIWVEDHISQVDPKNLNMIINEMRNNNIDYLNYTWFFKEFITSWYEKIDKLQSNNLLYFQLDKKNHRKITKNKRGYNYLISLPSIFSKRLLIKNLKCNRPFLRRWPKETPFDFEKTHNDTYILPYKMAIPKYELFACIDDDNGNPGYCLQSRGLYNKQNLREVRIELKFKFIPLSLKKLIKRFRYHFFSSLIF
jgi:hypothetical protein